MESPADTYTIYKKIGNCNMNDLIKALSILYYRKKVHVCDHNKSKRTGLDIPIYCLSTSNSPVKNSKLLDIGSMLAGMTSERAIEYKFLIRNLNTLFAHARILDIGTGNSNLVEFLNSSGDNVWQVVGIDLVRPTPRKNCNFFLMDGRCLGFSSNIFDVVICISTMEHITNTLPCNDDINNLQEEIKVLKEISRVLNHSGKLVLTLPFGKSNLMIPQHRVYNTLSLNYMLENNNFEIVEKEFYVFDLKDGIWKRRNIKNIDFNYIPDRYPAYLHSPVCLCISLKKT
jgi:SAM-dependent methyltransferase